VIGKCNVPSYFGMALLNCDWPSNFDAADCSGDILPKSEGKKKSIRGTSNS
jgi:hypothetical protein